MIENRVLIIDDDQRICRIIKRVADDLGIESFAIDNPELFEATILDFQPNIIFMDLQMPRLDGVELLRKLADQHSEAAIILASGMDKSVIETTGELGNSLGLNMAGFLQKPIEIDTMIAILQRPFETVTTQAPKSIKVTEEELEKAITQNELVVHYQPQIHLSSGKIVGLEALVRWQHPEHGLLLPDVVDRRIEVGGVLGGCLLSFAINGRVAVCGETCYLLVNFLTTHTYFIRNFLLRPARQP